MRQQPWRVSIVGLFLWFLVFLSSVQLVLASPQSTVPSPSHLSVSARGADMRELLHALSVQYGVNIVMDTGVTGPVTIHLAAAPSRRDCAPSWRCMASS